VARRLIVPHATRQRSETVRSQQLRAVGTAGPALGLLTDCDPRRRRELHRPHILWLVQSRAHTYVRSMVGKWRDRFEYAWR
jgi:hypothetical protein